MPFGRLNPEEPVADATAVCLPVNVFAPRTASVPAVAGKVIAVALVTALGDTVVVAPEAPPFAKPKLPV